MVLMAQHNQIDSSSKEFSLTLMRGLSVLELFVGEHSNLTTSEVAVRIDISRAAARRLLITLESLGYLQSNGRVYRRGRKGLRAADTNPFPENVRQTILARVLSLSNRLNEPCSVTVLVGLQTMFVIRDEQRRIFSAPLRVGDRLNANCSASGKVLLATLAPDDLKRRLADAGALSGYTDKSITTISALERELRSVRLRGWAKAEDEVEEGTISLAVPIFDAENHVIAALSVASHKTRRTVNDLIDKALSPIQDLAEIISAQTAKR